MPERVLVFGALSDRMRARLGDAVELVEPEDPHAWLDREGNGAGITGVIVMSHFDLSEPVLAKMPNLRVLSSFGVGYDHVDARAAAARGIVVTHTPDVLNEEVASTAVMLMLACYRNLLGDDAYVRSGRWEREGNAPLTRTADGRRVGLLGMGRIGQAIARKLAAFDADISYHARNRRDVPYTYFDDLAEMARAVEVLIVITPGGAATRHLVNAEVLGALGPEGMLINVGRGSVVDEPALVRALEEGRLGWAGLDVFENEPHVPEALKAMPNVVLLPHVGSATVETRNAMADLTVDNLLSFFREGRAIAPVPECQAL